MLHGDLGVQQLQAAQKLRHEGTAKKYRSDVVLILTRSKIHCSGAGSDLDIQVIH